MSAIMGTVNFNDKNNSYWLPHFFLCFALKYNCACCMYECATIQVDSVQ